MTRRQKYTCRGSVRGDCGRQHRSLSGALACCERDMRDVKRGHGGAAYSDRSPVRTDGSALSDVELAEISDWEDRPL